MSNIHEWYLNGRLCRARRPGYRMKRQHVLTQQEVNCWIQEMKGHGVAGVLCLLDWDQLEIYDMFGPGLLASYEAAGLKVAHVPLPDYRDPSLSPKDEPLVLSAWRTLPKPMVVHCSMGLIRSKAAVELIIKQPGT